jgi:hypothetical protein
LDPAGVTELSVVAGIRPRPAHGVSLGQALSVWLRVAALSFGGPAGQIAVMHRIIVDEKKWVGESRFLHALSYCMLLPGPEAQQLATYIGWLMHRWPGGMEVPPPMGSANAINFQPTGGGKAAITGDFVLIAKEVNPVLKALREHGIEVTAIHNHMLDDQPHLYFMHFWASDDARKLAEGLKAALAQINIAKS